MSNLEKNLAALESKDPAAAAWVKTAEAPDGLVVAGSKSGLPVPRMGNIALHSLYYPEKEADRFAETGHDIAGKTVTVFGFGFGYHLEKIAVEAGGLTVIEPSPGMIRAAFEARDLAGLVERAEIVSPERFAESADGLDYSKTVWLDHEPSARLHGKERALLAEPYIVRSQAVSRRYKVLVVGPVYGGSAPTAVSVSRALKSLGFDVDFMDNTGHKNELFSIDKEPVRESQKKALKTLFNNYMGERIAARADNSRPDMILALAQAPIPPNVIDRLKALGAPVVFWFVENYRAIPYWRLVAPHYDYFFCMQKGEFIEMLAEAGAPYAGYLPQAADPAVHHPAPLSGQDREKYGGAVSFMGAGYPNRRAFFSALLDLPVKIWGTEWELGSPLGQRVQNANRRLTPEEYVKIFLASDINLNLHSSTTASGIDPLNDFVNPRTFEIPACGAFQLVDYRRELPEMFEMDREIAVFRNMDGLREKINHYLKNPDERRAIAEAGMRRVLKEHTFVNRLARMMSVVIPREEKRIEQARAGRRGINDVDAMIQRVDDPELAAFLEKFRGQGNLSLKKVMDAIAAGEGALSRTEAIFVMVDQVLSQGE